MKLIIIRHGQTELNEKDTSIVQGVTDTNLSDKGKKQVEKLAVVLKDQKIDIIYSSPLNRALDTAIAIHKYHSHSSLVVDDDLKEIDFGIFDGLSMHEIKEKYPDIWIARENNKMNHKIPNGESFSEGFIRANRILNKIISLNKDAIIVAHGGINKLLYIKLLNTTLKDLDKINFDNTNISIFNIYKGKVKVELFNESRHLQ